MAWSPRARRIVFATVFSCFVCDREKLSKEDREARIRMHRASNHLVKADTRRRHQTTSYAEVLSRHTKKVYLGAPLELAPSVTFSTKKSLAVLALPSSSWMFMLRPWHVASATASFFRTQRGLVLRKLSNTWAWFFAFSFMFCTWLDLPCFAASTPSDVRASHALLPPQCCGSGLQ